MKQQQKGRELKVYGGNLFAFGEQVRAVIAARSINEVAHRLGETHYTISRMWCETGNEKETAKAKRNPGNPIVVSCLTRNEERHSLEELQCAVDRRYEPKVYIRPYIRKGMVNKRGIAQNA